MHCKNISDNDFYKENLFDCTFIDNEKFFDHHIVLTKIQSVINKKMDTK